MSDRPILFSAPMVRALLDGSKTQTRRAIKLPAAPDHLGQWEPTVIGGAGVTDARGVVVPEHAAIWHTRTGRTIGSPFGTLGDRLWVRESFSGPWHQERHPPRDWHSTDPIHYWAGGNPDAGDWTRPRPGMFMPRWASRITLEVTGVRVERLQDISDSDAWAEGIDQSEALSMGCTDDAARAAYSALWESINGPGSWDANPWVWVIEFRRLG